MWFIFHLLIFLVCAEQLWAQTPEQVVTSYFEKLKTGGINTVASLMHPDELRKFREMLTPVVEGGLASNQAKRFQIFADPQEQSKMRRLTDAEFMNVFMEWVETVQPG